MGSKKDDRARFEFNVTVDFSPRSEYTQVSIGYPEWLDNFPELRQHLFKMAVEHFAHATAKSDPDGYEKTMEYFAGRLFNVGERLHSQAISYADEDGKAPKLDLPDDDEECT